MLSFVFIKHAIFKGTAMKKLSFLLLIITFLVLKLVGMEEDYAYLTTKYIAKKNTKFLRCLRYFILQKSIPNMVIILKKIKRNSSDLDEIEQKQIQNNIVTFMVNNLSLPNQFLNYLKTEFYDLGAHNGLSSNDTSPRIEDNDLLSDNESDNLCKVPQYLEDIRAVDEPSVLQTTHNDRKKVPFKFLIRIIKNFEELQDSVKQVQSELRLDCLEGNATKFFKHFAPYDGLIDLDDLNGVHKSLLHYAVESGNEKMLLHLLQKGADTEVITMHGDTPLLLAVKRKNKCAIKWLLLFGANPFMTDKDGLCQQYESGTVRFNRIDTEQSFDVLFMRKPQSQKSKKQSYINHFVKNLTIDARLRFLAQAGNLAGVKKLLDILQEKYSKVKRIRYFIINSVDERKGSSALHLAINQKNRHMILYLLENDADPNIQDNQGNTPLHYAVQNEYLEGVVLLLFIDNPNTDELAKNHCDLTIRNNHGYTALDIAEIIGSQEIAKAIKAKKSKRSRKDYDAASLLTSFSSLSDEADTDLEEPRNSYKKSKETKLGKPQKKERRKSLSFSMPNLRNIIYKKDKDKSASEI